MTYNDRSALHVHGQVDRIVYHIEKLIPTVGRQKVPDFGEVPTAGRNDTNLHQKYTPWNGDVLQPLFNDRTKKLPILFYKTPRPAHTP